MAVDISLSPREALDELRKGSLSVLGRLAIVVGYCWVAFIIWPITGDRASLPLWIGSVSFMALALTSYALRKRVPQIASVALLVGIIVAIACVALGSRTIEFCYLLILPVSFAGVLLGASGSILTSAAALACVASIGWGRFGLSPWSGRLLLLDATLALSAVASVLSAHSLYTVLDWLVREYQRALHNERIARERAAELRQALKALDEATYRLERTNYMLKLARKQADEARHLKQQFAQTISHELRTPLSIIVAFTELMAQSPEYYGPPLPSCYVRDMSIVHRNARHLHGLVSDVLDLARIDAAQMSLVLHETDPAELVREAITTVRSLVESRGLALLTDIAPDLPPLRLDPMRIRQVLFNLVNNATRFTERGSVTVRVRQLPQEIEFSVVDTGVGIASEDIPRIFHEFEQLDQSGTRPREGVGLGLAISKAFVELHSGHISVNSEQGRGSTFFFTLPILDPEALTLRASPLQEVPGTLTHSGAEPIVLVVTRSISAAGLLTRHIQGARIVVAHDLEQAQAIAQQFLPQIVVVDMASASLENPQLETLGEAWHLPDIPFVGCPLPGEEPLRQKLVADGYLIKPVSREAVWDALRPFGESIDQVLVVDDDPDFVRLMSRILDNPVRRYEVIGAYSAQEALQMLQYRQPDLVLLDLGLPDMNGLQVLERMRAAQSWRDIPVVIVSGQEEIGDLQTLIGGMVITRANGLRPGEVVRWLQGVLETTTQTSLSVRG